MSPPSVRQLFYILFICNAFESCFCLHIFSACFVLGTLTKAWMITIVETQTDAKDPGALPQTQIHPGSTATSQFAVSIYSCLFVCGWIHYHLSCMLRSSLCPSVSGSVAAQCGSTKYDWLQQNLLLPVPFILPFLPSSWLMLKNIQTHTHPPTQTDAEPPSPPS